jgi:hypothetical protein
LAARVLINMLQRALEAAGVEFVDGEPGVKLRKAKPFMWLKGVLEPAVFKVLLPRTLSMRLARLIRQRVPERLASVV